MRKSYAWYFTFSLMIFLLLTITPSPYLAEEPNPKKSEGDKQELRTIEAGLEDPMYGSSYGDYKGEDIHYMLDLANPNEIDDKGFFSTAWNFISLQVVDDKVSEAIHYSIFFVVETSFKLNIFMTNIMLSILNFSYSTNIINSLIDNTGETVRSLTGISGTSFGSNGLFGGFLGLIGLLVALYTLYQYIVKKASITAFSGILKSMLALTLALLFFSNYSAVLKGAHTVSTDLSAALLSGNVSINMDKKSGLIEDTTIREKMNDNIFTMFVHKPYLMLQYGTTIEEDIGSNRVRELLSAPKGDERKNIIISEVTERGNESLTYSNVVNRLVFAWVMQVTNAISSIPIYLLALSLIVFQFWFLVIALIAPFVFLWSALPNQFGVLKRYFFELSIPLVLKMGLSVVALILFGITDVLYNINTLGGGTQGYIITTLIQSLILFTLFLLRKRIFNVFSVGSKEISIMREQMNATFMEPAQKGVRTTMATGGALVGAIAGGPQGAIAGANMGSSLGKAATGQSGVGDMAKDVSLSMIMGRRSMMSNPAKKNQATKVNLIDRASESGDPGNLKGLPQPVEIPSSSPPEQRNNEKASMPMEMNGETGSAVLDQEFVSGIKEAEHRLDTSNPRESPDNPGSEANDAERPVLDPARYDDSEGVGRFNQDSGRMVQAEPDKYRSQSPVFLSDKVRPEDKSKVAPEGNAERPEPSVISVEAPEGSELNIQPMPDVTGPILDSVMDQPEKERQAKKKNKEHHLQDNHPPSEKREAGGRDES